MNYKWIRTNQLVQRIADGAQIPVDTGNSDWKKVLEFVAGGGIIQPEDAPSPPIDLSNIDNLDRVLKAIGLCIAELHGLTPFQVKNLFKQKYDSLEP